MKFRQHIKKYFVWYLYFGFVALFIIGAILLQIFYPEAFWYDNGWRW